MSPRIHPVKRHSESAVRQRGFNRFFELIGLIGLIVKGAGRWNIIYGFRCRVSGVSPAAGQTNGRSNRKKNLKNLAQSSLRTLRKGILNHLCTTRRSPRWNIKTMKFHTIEEKKGVRDKIKGERLQLKGRKNSNFVLRIFAHLLTFCRLSSDF
jgi:hypothetical protein